MWLLHHAALEVEHISAAPAGAWRRKIDPDELEEMVVATKTADVA